MIPPIVPKTASEGAAGAAIQDRNIRERLRTRREQLAKASSRLFVLPGYDVDNEELGGQLVARYRRLTFEELTAALKADGESDIVAINAQFLVDACDDILFRDEDGLQQLVPGHRTTFTINLETGESLATFLGVEAHDSVRAQMVAAFGGNELVLNDHSGEVHRWMVAANEADAGSALGEA